jgi:PHP family Zn ribbon phosphoesterase
MNWRVSLLDGLTLVSNSDAHSPLKLGREANIINTNLSYLSIRNAIKKGDPKSFLGTFEFYPEEGKYHLDGHRKCDIRFWPAKTRKKNGQCPICGKPMTLGVLYRVEELADRPEGDKPEKTHPFINIIPLTEILSEVLKVGPGSKKVMRHYSMLLEKLGPEIDILHTKKIENINSAGGPLLGEAISRMRQNKVVVDPGYDGEFGKIKIFNNHEREKILGQKTLFIVPSAESTLQNKIKNKKKAPTKKERTCA